MTTLRLHPEFLPALIEGRKTTTVRAGWRDLPPGPGVVEAGRQSIEVLVTGVRHCRYADLTLEDARRDGFESLEQLRSALRRFYPKLSDSSAVSVIGLKLLPQREHHR